MAQISSSDEFKQRSSPVLDPTRPKEVDKEEALQMEAEALAKMQKERVVVGSRQKSDTLSYSWPNVQSCRKQDHDLMVFPESDGKKKMDDKLNSIDIDKLTCAELEKLLLEENLESHKPSTLSATQILGASSSQFYSHPVAQRGQWTSSLPGSSSCAGSSVYPVPSFSKQVGVFQNGLHPAVSTYQSTKPAYLCLPERSQYISYALPFTSTFHPQGNVPMYHSTLSPEMAKVFDKIASTSEFQKNGKSKTDLEMTGAKSTISLSTSESSNDISKFDWLDLDPLSKPKVDNIDIFYTSEDGGKITNTKVVEDPWDAVLLEEKSPGKSHLERKLSGKSASGATVTRSQSLNIRTAQLAKLQGQTSQIGYFEANIVGTKKACILRTKFPHTKHDTNLGFVLSPVMLQRNVSGENSSIKISIEIEGFQQPVTFTCDVSSPVELIIMQALCWVHDDLNNVDIGSYILKVCGQEEVLQKDLARTEDDDGTPIDLAKHLCHVEKFFRETIQSHSLEELLEAYHNQVDIILKNKNRFKAVEPVIEAVKKICSALDGVETPAITEAVNKLKRTVKFPGNKSPEGSIRSSDDTSKNPVGPLQSENPLQMRIDQLTSAVHALLQLHLNSYHSPSLSTPRTTKSTKEAWTATEHLQFTVFAAHGIANNWVSVYEKYYLVCSLTHNGKDLFKPVQSKKVGTYKSFFYLIIWDELIIFPIQISQLPLESILCLTLFGILNQNSGNSPDSNKQRKGPEMLGQVSLPLFDFERMLTCGTKLLHLWTPLQSLCGVAHKKGNLMERIVLQVDFPSLPFDIIYRIPQAANNSTCNSIETLEKDSKERLLSIISKEGTYGLSKKNKAFLWEKRHYCYTHASSLPKILASAPNWDLTNLSEIYLLLQQWPPLPPLSALELLNANFADQEVRTKAVQWIEAISDDELADILPQFVQALKYETYLDNSLVRFLLARALGNIRIAHYLYWLLKDTLHDTKHGIRYEHILGAFLSICGKSLREELERQSRLVQILGMVAEKVKRTSGSARQIVLQSGMERVQSFFLKNKCRLPLSPSLVAKELNVKACSYFSSNAVPLKIALVNADPLGEEINVMFKVGEDLRQDMLALQMIKIMDKIWLQEGLDLRMVMFKCLATGKDRGMVELVPASDTLRKIQVEYGVTGSFKDKPLAEWLRKYNSTEEEYEKASENFIYSCAGCCVATYVLGICDRHNDNIMLRSTGHMFHIDFGKFLGHAQMFGTFKRDRAPFVLTSDMAYVINGGEKPTIRFQLFVDLCCQAYNLIRKQANLFLNLLSLMMSSGLPELTGVQDLKYVQDALQPQTTDAEATIFFTRLIESSLGSVATKFNFFIHNLAQLRFSGLPSNDEPILSFSPKTYSLKQDGRIKEASVFTYHKRYNPDKYYIYVVRVLREGQTEPTFIFRTFDEFQELHNKLGILFPLWKLPGFPSKMVLGRTHVKDVAAKRKVELNSYIQSLMNASTDVSECDLIYTFFHPLPRDEKAEGIDGITRCTGIVNYCRRSLSMRLLRLDDMSLNVTDDGADPNPYVKTYLLPDMHKTSKRKTKISRKTRNPTFNEMLVYSGYSKETLKQRELQLSVLSAESLRENFFLGGITLSLKDFNLSKETVNWYRLAAAPYL
ncbi:hypothetical protein Chor_016407 [Crotalus horridus]